jgi:hypothetical protein
MLFNETSHMKWTSSVAARGRHFAYLVVAFFLAAPANAETANRLLGIPFGDKLQLGRCGADTRNAKKPCWIDKPFFHKTAGTTSGYVFFPDADARPKWAARAMFSLVLDKVGTVQEIKVNTYAPAERFEIAQSISRRLGKPITDRLSSADSMAAYCRTNEGTAQIRCHNECWVEFRTLEAQAVQDARVGMQ